MKKFRHLALLSAMAMMASLSGCASTGTGSSSGSASAAQTSSGSAPAAEDTIKVGILHSQSGTMAMAEKPMIQAVEMAIDEINASGGVLGKQITYVSEDGASDAAIFAEKATKLLTKDNVATIFGCWTSAS